MQNVLSNAVTLDTIRCLLQLPAETVVPEIMFASDERNELTKAL